MSLTTYGELKAAIAARAARSDLTALIPDFVTIAHFNILNGLFGPSGDYLIPPLRIFDMLAEDTLTPSEGEATLGAACLQVRKVTSATTGAKPLVFKSPVDFGGMPMRNDSGIPQFYTVEGATLKIAPFNGNTLTVWQYETIDALVDDSDTNAIFTRCPQAYLFAAMAELNDHIRQHDRAAFYLAKAGGVVGAANRASDAREQGGDALVMMPPTIA